mgnify:CR=1 FL=1
MKCRLCEGGTRLLVARADLSLHRCLSCGFVSGWPTSEITPEERYAGYHEAPPLPAPEDRYHEWMGRAEAKLGRGRLLEVGAGSGGFVRVALSRGWAVEATELSGSGLARLRETGAKIFAGDLLAARYPDAAFDWVVSLEVIEHLPLPTPHLRELARITRPGGLLLLTTPSFGGLSRRLLGFRWRVVTPEHLGYFTARTLERSLRQAGYRRIQIASRSLDVTTWRRASEERAQFNPQAAAQLRDTVEGSRALRWSKTLINLALRATGLGDTLLAWAER